MVITTVVERLKECGFSPKRIFGNFYLCRIFSKDYKGKNIIKNILKHIFVITVFKDEVICDINVVVPKGELRID